MPHSFCHHQQRLEPPPVSGSSPVTPLPHFQQDGAEQQVPNHLEDSTKLAEDSPQPSLQIQSIANGRLHHHAETLKQHVVGPAFPTRTLHAGGIPVPTRTLGPLRTGALDAEAYKPPTPFLHLLPVQQHATHPHGIGPVHLQLSTRFQP